MEKLAPGVETDRLVAEKVMGWLIVEAGEEEWFEKKVTRFPCFATWPEGGADVFFSDGPDDCRLWRPSQDLIHALEAVDEINPLYFGIGRENCMGIRFDILIYNDLDMTDRVALTSENLPLGICEVLLEFIERKNALKPEGK